MRAQSRTNPCDRRRVSPGDLRNNPAEYDGTNYLNWIVEPESPDQTFEDSYALADTLEALPFGSISDLCKLVNSRWVVTTDSERDAKIETFRAAANDWLDLALEGYIGQQFELKRLEEMKDLWASASSGSALYLDLEPLMSRDANSPGYLAAQYFEGVVAAFGIKEATTVAGLYQIASDLLDATDPGVYASGSQPGTYPDGTSKPNLARHEPPPLLRVSVLNTKAKTV